MLMHMTEKKIQFSGNYGIFLTVLNDLWWECKQSHQDMKTDFIAL